MGRKNIEHYSSVKFIVNGESVELRFGHRWMPWHTLAYTLREVLGLKGTKVGCDNGECGACTVIMNGKSILSCTTLTVDCNGKDITTIEGLGNPLEGRLHPLQAAFIKNDGMQCGFCTPGMIMAAKALLDREPDPIESRVKEELSGNLCRCGSYKKILDSVLDAASEIRRNKA